MKVFQHGFTVALLLLAVIANAQEQPGGQRNRGSANPPGGGGGPGGFMGFGRGRIIDPPADFVSPPTLRIGLLGVLKQTPGASSESAVAEVLQTTGRAVELAYATRILEDRNPGKYRDAALEGAKYLLVNPITVETPTRYDRDSKSYLYGILLYYSDTSFAPQAQSLLVTGDGRIDSATLEYLNRSLKGAAIMPVLGQLYRDARLTNQTNRATILNTAFQYTGLDASANQMFLETMKSEDAGFLRFMAMRSLTQIEGSTEGTLSAEVRQQIVGRQQLLQMSTSGITDERFLSMVQQTSQNLQNLLDGKPVEQFGPPRVGPGF
ncbi:MAG TPA: hypothetical protein VK968_13880 [Roseimicrobium sp.]|nr:hypothetical protein [Roseimicrobium sp.]